MLEIREREWTGFQPKMNACGCYLKVEGRLLLIRQAHKRKDPGKWGVPGGKLEPGEDPLNGARRELFEETGLFLQEPLAISPFKVLYIRLGDLDYVFHMFQVHLKSRPEIHLSAEHTAFIWAEPADFDHLDFRPGAKEAISYYIHSI